MYRAMYKGTPVAVKRWFDPDLTEELLQEFREEVCIRVVLPCFFFFFSRLNAACEAYPTFGCRLPSFQPAITLQSERECC